MFFLANVTRVAPHRCLAGEEAVEPLSEHGESQIRSHVDDDKDDDKDDDEEEDDDEEDEQATGVVWEEQGFLTLSRFLSKENSLCCPWLSSAGLGGNVWWKEAGDDREKDASEEVEEGLLKDRSIGSVCMSSGGGDNTVVGFVANMDGECEGSSSEHGGEEAGEMLTRGVP